MANRTQLLCLDHDFAPLGGSDNSAQVLAGASYTIPVMWYGLFQEDCLVQRNQTPEHGGPLSYLVLQSPKPAAMARLRAFKERALPLFPSRMRMLYEAFEGFLAAAPGAILAIETFELWIMAEPPAMEQQFRACLSAVLTDPAARTGRALDPGWQLLLDQANITRGRAGGVPPHALFGYSWVAPVPWSPTAYCQPCGRVGDHDVISLAGTRPGQVECKKCKARHGYSLRHPLDEAQERTPPSAARTYAPTDHYAPGELLRHATLGLGVVLATPAPGKMDVAFQYERKLLVHDRAGSAPSPPPKR